MIKKGWGLWSHLLKNSSEIGKKSHSVTTAGFIKDAGCLLYAVEYCSWFGEKFLIRNVSSVFNSFSIYSSAVWLHKHIKWSAVRESHCADGAIGRLRRDLLHPSSQLGLQPAGHVLHPRPDSPGWPHCRYPLGGSSSALQIPQMKFLENTKYLRCGIWRVYTEILAPFLSHVSHVLVFM